MALNPSTILLLFRKMNEHRDALIRDVERGGLSPDFPVSDEVRAHVSASYAGNPARASELRALLDRDGELFARNVWSGLRLVVSWRSPMQRPYLQLLEPHLGAVPGEELAVPIEQGAELARARGVAGIARAHVRPDLVADREIGGSAAFDIADERCRC